MAQLTPRFEAAYRAQGYSQVIGCDEVGRGCLAGPVVAAAVVLPLRLPRGEVRDIIRDSKALRREQRQQADAYLRSCILGFGVGEASVEEVDALNIHYASLLAMRRAVEGVGGLEGEGGEGTMLLIDGRFIIPGINVAQKSFIHGDAKVLSIAAASIIAKEYRDKMMEQLHAEYPMYGLAQHKGYATAVHRKALEEHGISPIHRRTFCH